ncbi:MAG: GtrA family protein, partial [Firmicutes bacterium]|nr:GtrA family protein [Bacillota bacterium]
FMQFVKFGIIGLSNTVISYILNVAVLLILSPFSVSWDFFAGNMVGFLLSVLWSFYWNNRFVFTMQEGQQRSVWKALLKTYLAYGFTGIILNNILSWLWITKFGISKFIAPVINLIVSVPLNFIINKLWAFRAE